MVALDDLDDGAPLIDVRLAERARGQGLGVPVVRALAGTVFAGYPTSVGSRHRPGTTTSRCGRSWSGAVGPGGAAPAGVARRGRGAEDSVAYGLLREDHRSGRVTPFYGRFDAGE